MKTARFNFFLLHKVCEQLPMNIKFVMFSWPGSQKTCILYGMPLATSGHTSHHVNCQAGELHWCLPLHGSLLRTNSSSGTQPPPTLTITVLFSNRTSTIFCFSPNCTQEHNYAHTHTHQHTYLHMYTCLPTGIHVHTCIHFHTYKHPCTHILTNNINRKELVLQVHHLTLGIHVHTCIHTHTHTQHPYTHK